MQRPADYDLRVLVVDDDPAALLALRAFLEANALVVATAASVAAARECFASFYPSMVLLDVVLPDGLATALAQEFLARRPAPRVVATSGLAERDVTFWLGQCGVHAFLEKPVSSRALLEALRGNSPRPREVASTARAWVGQKPLAAVQAEIRAEMTQEALALSDGNLTGAGELLGVTRQAVQYIVKEESLVVSRPTRRRRR